MVRPSLTSDMCTKRNQYGIIKGFDKLGVCNHWRLLLFVPAFDGYDKKERVGQESVSRSRLPK